MPKVSICVPVFKVEKFIERCVDSICRQTLDDIEIIFINDASPDRSWDILKATLSKFPKRKDQVVLLENDINSGQAVARQKCASVAMGEYLYFADADDWLQPEMLESMYLAALENDADIVGCQAWVYPLKGKRFLAPFSNPESKEKSISGIISKNKGDYSVSIALWTRLIRKSIYRQTFVSEEELEGTNRLEDFINVVKCHFFSKKVVWIDKPFYNFNRRNPLSVTKTVDLQAVESEIRMILNLERFFADRGISIFNEEMNFLKLKTKNRFIKILDIYDPRRWRSLWPELTYSHSAPLKTKIAMGLAVRKHDKILWLINWLFNCLRPLLD